MKLRFLRKELKLLPIKFGTKTNRYITITICKTSFSDENYSFLQKKFVIADILELLIFKKDFRLYFGNMMIKNMTKSKALKKVVEV